jgi:hypothetical protein
MAADRAIGAGLEHNERDAARADVMKAVRSIVMEGGVVADEMGWSCIDVFAMSNVKSGKSMKLGSDHVVTTRARQYRFSDLMNEERIKSIIIRKFIVLSKALYQKLFSTALRPITSASLSLPHRRTSIEPFARHDHTTSPIPQHGFHEADHDSGACPPSHSSTSSCLKTANRTYNICSLLHKLPSRSNTCRTTPIRIPHTTTTAME